MCTCCKLKWTLIVLFFFSTLATGAMATPEDQKTDSDSAAAPPIEKKSEENVEATETTTPSTPPTPAPALTGAPENAVAGTAQKNEKKKRPLKSKKSATGRKTVKAGKAARSVENEQRIAAKKAEREQRIAAKKAEREQRIAAKKAEREQRIAAKKAEREQRIAAKKARREQLKALRKQARDAWREAVAAYDNYLNARKTNKKARIEAAISSARYQRKQDNLTAQKEALATVTTQLEKVAPEFNAADASMKKSVAELTQLKASRPDFDSEKDAQKRKRLRSDYTARLYAARKTKRKSRVKLNKLKPKVEFLNARKKILEARVAQITQKISEAAARKSAADKQAKVAKSSLATAIEKKKSSLAAYNSLMQNELLKERVKPAPQATKQPEPLPQPATEPESAVQPQPETAAPQQPSTPPANPSVPETE